MKMVLIANAYFATNETGVSVERFKAGGHYPVDDDSLRQVELRNGTLVDVPEPEPEAAAPEKPRRGRPLQVNG